MRQKLSERPPDAIVRMFCRICCAERDLTPAEIRRYPTTEDAALGAMCMKCGTTDYKREHAIEISVIAPP